MIDFLLFTVLSYCLFDNLFRILHRYQISRRDSSYLLSTLHAVLIVILHGYLMIFSRNLTIFSPITLSPGILNDHLGTYNFVYSFCLGYALADMVQLSDFYTGKYNAGMMLFHHFLMILASILCFYVTNFTLSFNSWYMSLGHLSEVSTPLLNYIQYRHGKVPLGLKYFFAFIYFLCRPLNLSYLSYIGYQKYGLNSVLTITCIFLTLLNYFWCYRIYLKSMDLEKEYHQGQKLLDQQRQTSLLVQPSPAVEDEQIDQKADQSTEDQTESADEEERAIDKLLDQALIDYENVVKKEH